MRRNRRTRAGSDKPVRASLLLASCWWVAASAFGASLTASLTQGAEQQGDLEVAVALDAAEQTGKASATMRIHASREVVWSLITNCAESLKMVPGLVGCEVLETAPDGSWQIIRHVLDYSWYLRRLTYEIRATYGAPKRMSVERVSGDLRTMNFTWNLASEGDTTVASYVIEIAPGFWVPHWLVRGALKRDLPKMLRALRARAESRQLNPSS